MALDLTDKSGNSNTLTNNGAAEYVDNLPFIGCSKAALFVSGESDYMQRADTATLSVTGDCTFECWVNFVSLPANGATMYLASKLETSKYSYSFGVYNNAGTYTLRASYSNDGSSVEDVDKSVSGGSLSTGTWYHFAFAFDASAASTEYYQNGSSLSTSSGSFTAIHDNDSVFELGHRPVGDGYLNGILTNVRLWGDIRSSGEISGNYQKVISATGDDLNANWTFGDYLAPVKGNYAYFM